jgi:hypothetical protein
MYDESELNKNVLEANITCTVLIQETWSIQKIELTAPCLVVL